MSKRLKPMPYDFGEDWKARAEQAEAERDELIEMIRFWYDELSTGGAGACALPASMLCVLEEAQQEGKDECRTRT